eukprot:9499352-Pyramimonas_sp.AAC.1
MPSTAHRQHRDQHEGQHQERWQKRVVQQPKHTHQGACQGRFRTRPRSRPRSCPRCRPRCRRSRCGPADTIEPSTVDLVIVRHRPCLSILTLATTATDRRRRSSTLRRPARQTVLRH